MNLAHDVMARNEYFNGVVFTLLPFTPRHGFIIFFLILKFLDNFSREFLVLFETQ